MCSQKFHKIHMKTTVFKSEVSDNSEEECF